MKRPLLLFSAVCCFLSLNSTAQVADQSALAKLIRTDSRLDTIQARAIKLLTGFSAGTSYDEVWIRDFNTFIKGSLKVHPKEKVRSMLLMFFKIQGADGNIVDGVVDSAKANGGYKYRYSALLPGEENQDGLHIKILWKLIRNHHWYRLLRNILILQATLLFFLSEL